MLIDWFTVIAQIINFLILLAILKYFLFNRISAAMRARKQAIDSAIDDAASKSEQASQELDAYRQKTRDIEEQRARLIEEAEQDARKQGETELEQVRTMAREEQKHFEEALFEKKREVAERLRRLSLSDAAGITRHALMELAESPVEERLVDVFVRRLKDIPEARRKELTAAVRNSGRLAVKGSFPITAPLRKRLQDAVAEEFPEGASIEYRQVPDMILGIEMDLNCYKVRWSVDDFIRDVEQGVSNVLAEIFGRKRGEDHA